MKWVFRVDSSDLIGTGHVMRCLALADWGKKDGRSSLFIMRDHTGHVGELVKRSGFPVQYLLRPTQKRSEEPQWLGVSQEVDAKETLAALQGYGSPDWLIVDHYGISADWHREVRGHSKRIMAIDDLADREFDADLVLNQNYFSGNSPQPYLPHVPKTTKVLIGPQYAILRGEFQIARSQAQARGSLKKLLINFGGLDAQGFTQTILRAIKDLLSTQRIQAHVILGGANPHWQTIAQEHGSWAKIERHCEDMPKALLDADLAIGAAGTTTWERCCLGLPSIVYSIADNQTMVAENLHQDGYVWYLGKSDGFEAKSLQDLFLKIFDHPQLLAKMSEKSLSLVDGSGAPRLIDVMKSVRPH